jgi:AraC family transcriptional regulator
LPAVTTLCRGEGWVADEVRCSAGPKDRPFEEHHERPSVAIVLKGTFTYRSEHGRQLMSVGSVLLGNAGKCFECGHEHSRGDHCLAFHFEPTTLEEMAAQIGGCREWRFAAGRVPPQTGTVALLSAAESLHTDPSPLLAQQIAFDLVRLAIGARAQDEAPVGSREERRIADLLHYIDDHLADPLSLDILAQVVGVGRFHVLRTFRRTVGETPYAYILNRRLQTAARLLRLSSAPIMQTALEAGFGDISEFTRHFVKRHGITPGAYQRRFAPSRGQAPRAE